MDFSKSSTPLTVQYSLLECCLDPCPIPPVTYGIPNHLLEQEIWRGTRIPGPDLRSCSHQLICFLQGLNRRRMMKVRWTDHMAFHTPRSRYPGSLWIQMFPYFLQHFLSGFIPGTRRISILTVTSCGKSVFESFTDIAAFDTINIQSRNRQHLFPQIQTG